ncbi:DUF3488 and transglutaminase-like domain-containing protein [Haloechinothrix salitolerans]|uniref:DUF3488 and transglutaminase-like domain-containing protein n=1 Tax=Haloechinothrix salitolerans TaxID=926830 RepID=A0ABW2C1F1_9PSEU
MSQPAPARRGQHDWAGSIIAPAAAGVATVCSATALTGVIKGWSWLSYVIVAVVLVVCTGLALRSLRTPALVVGLGQILVLLLLVTGMFTSSGILAIIPGPAAFAELNEVLTAAGGQIRTSLPPVTASTPILCLATIGIGLVAVLVDTVAVTVAAPAASGLVLLCLYAVPASLADELLPWWTFVLGAGTFAVLIALDSGHRHRGWQGRHGRQHPSERVAMASTPSIVVSVAIVCGLLAGATVTTIGTVGQLPFNSGGGNRGPTAAGLGLQPFTELQGLLNQQSDIELFRVRGLEDDERLMRAFTLDTYAPNEGWRLRPGPMPAGVVANDRLPRAAGDNVGQPRTIRIEPVRWRDVWLPIYGKPRQITGIDDSWYYDQVSGTIYTERARRPPPYTVMSSLAQPTKDQLSGVTADTGQIPALYSTPPPIDPRVRRLTDRIVAGETTTYGKAQALWRYFIDDGDFTYDTETASNAGTNALAHFLLEGKRGYCAQFASAMAVMLRSEGIGARVAIGFTAGKRMNGYNSISTKDAHAWAEVYFGPNHGWVAFDPTPLDDGRGVVPDYLDDDTSSSSNGGPQERASGQDQRDNTPTPTPEPPEQADTRQAEDDTVSLARAPDWVRWPVLLLVLLATWMTVATVFVVRRTSELRSQPDSDTSSPLVRRLARARWWLPPATAAGWLLSIALVGWMASWLLAIALLLVTGALVAPALLREYHRGGRLHDILLGRPDAASAAWRELLDELADRGTPVAEAETVRETARRLASDYALDDEGQRHLDTIVRVLERSWYSGRTDVDPELAAAFEGLRTSVNDAAPLSWQGKLLPTSVMSGLPGRKD